jgi:hypothetical protein
MPASLPHALPPNPDATEEQLQLFEDLRAAVAELQPEHLAKVDVTWSSGDLVMAFSHTDGKSMDLYYDGQRTIVDGFIGPEDMDRTGARRLVRAALTGRVTEVECVRWGLAAKQRYEIVDEDGPIEPSTWQFIFPDCLLLLVPGIRSQERRHRLSFAHTPARARVD